MWLYFIHNIHCSHLSLTSDLSSKWVHFCKFKLWTSCEPVRWTSLKVLIDAFAFLTLHTHSLPHHLAFVLVPEHDWTRFLLPSWQFDLTNFLPSPAFNALDCGAMIYASYGVRFCSLNDGFFCSSNVVDPASRVIDMSQENTRNPAVSLPKVDWAQTLKKSHY